MYEALIKNARVYCGDIEIDEDKEDCGDYCIDSRDCRGTEIRWCRQWLIHDLCEAIEALQAELDRLKNCHHECKIVCLLDKYNKKCTELEKVKAERDKFEQMYLQSEVDATNLTGELTEVSAENARLRREREADA